MRSNRARVTRDAGAGNFGIGMVLTRNVALGLVIHATGAGVTRRALDLVLEHVVEHDALRRDAGFVQALDRLAQLLLRADLSARDDEYRAGMGADSQGV